MSELSEKVRCSIQRLKDFAPKNGEGYYLAFSGGKDSVVCKALLEMAGVKYDGHYRVTSVDPPELVQFIREKHPDIARDVPHWDTEYRREELAGKPITMWNLIPEKLMPPTRVSRYCCQYLKEDGGDGRLVVTGVRWAESRKRKENQGAVTIMNKKAVKELAEDNNFRANERGGVILVNDNTESRRTIEHCYQRMKTTVNPIIDWEDSEVWEFIKAEQISYCGLYDCGWSRLGCIGCPMAGQRAREKEFLQYPKYKEAYMRAFAKMLKRIEEKTMDTSWQGWENATPQNVFDRWMEYNIIPGQTDIFDPDTVSALYWL